MKLAGYTAADMRAAGSTAGEVKAAGYSFADAKDADFPLRELREHGGLTCGEAYAAGFSLSEAEEAGYSLKECSRAGYSTQKLTADTDRKWQPGEQVATWPASWDAIDSCAWAPERPEEGGGRARRQSFSVTIPAGAPPGRQFEAVLDGKMTRITVPQGVGECDELHVDARGAVVHIPGSTPRREEEEHVPAAPGDHEQPVAYRRVGQPVAQSPSGRRPPPHT